MGDESPATEGISDPKLAEIDEALSTFRPPAIRKASRGWSRSGRQPSGRLRTGPAVEIVAKLGIPMEIATENRESVARLPRGSLGQDGYAVIDNGSPEHRAVSKEAARRATCSSTWVSARIRFFFAAAEDPEAASVRFAIG